MQRLARQQLLRNIEDWTGRIARCTYSVSRTLWIATITDREHLNYCGTGDTPEKAYSDLWEKLQKRDYVEARPRDTGELYRGD